MADPQNNTTGATGQEPGSDPSASGNAGGGNPGPGAQPTPTTPSGGESWLTQLPAEAQAEIRRLRSEAGDYRSKAKEFETKVRQFEDRDKTDQQKLEERATTAESKAQAIEAKLQRFEVAAEKGLPSQLAGRLQGSTREELAADADKLMQEFGVGGGSDPSTPSFDAGARRPTGTGPKTMNGLIRQAVGSR